MKTKINYLFSALIIGALFTIASCSKDEELPQIDGYNSSDEVASTNLKAHWTFDSNNNEVISGTAPSSTFGTVGSTDGQMGKALQLTKGGLVFPAIANINTANALNNFTVSLWLKTAGNKGTANEGFSAFFGLIPTGVTDIWEMLWHVRKQAVTYQLQIL